MTRYVISRARLEAIRAKVKAKKNPSGAGVAVAVGAAAVVGVGGYLAYKYYTGGKLAVTLNGSAGPVVVNSGQDGTFYVTGITPGSGCRMIYSTTASPAGAIQLNQYTCPSCISGNASGGGTLSFTDTFTAGSSNINFYAAAYDETKNAYSNWISITVDATSSGSYGSGGSTTPKGCTSDADCPNCQSCFPDGTCAHRAPSQIVSTQDLSNYTQDETVLGVFGLCNWSTLAFYQQQNVFAGAGQIVDLSGYGVPCITVNLSDASGYLSIWNNPVVTDANGNFKFTFSLKNPTSGGAGCPALPGITTSGIIKGTINASVTGMGAPTPFVFAITTYVTGV